MQPWRIVAQNDSVTLELVAKYTTMDVAYRGSAVAGGAAAFNARVPAAAAAQQQGLGVQPVSPVFLYAHDDRELRELAPGRVDELRTLRQAFRTLTGTGARESQALVLRFVHAAPASVRSRRRGIDGDVIR